MNRAKTTSKMLVAMIAALAIAASLALVGCGGSGSSSSSSSGSSSTESSSSSSSTTESSESSDNSLADTVAEMAECYAGVCDDGSYIYYAGGDSGEMGILVLSNNDDGEYISFVGPTELDEDTGIITITDESTGNALEFIATSNDDGTLTIDAGDYGTATVSAVDNADMAEALEAIQSSMTPLQ